jgi:hypothetical protein
MTDRLLGRDNAKVEQVTLIGGAPRLQFKQDEASLRVQLPDEKPTHPGPYMLKIEGSELLGTSF